jgi:alkylation response protein AidB-like acyl-CoA dehydrogenase
MMDPLKHLQMVKARAAGATPRKGDLARITALRDTMPGFDRAVWREICEKGWLGLRIPKTAGGSGRGAHRFCRVAEQLGTELAPEPLITAAMAAQLLPQEHLAPVLAAERIVLPAWQENAHSLDAIGNTTFSNSKVSGRKLCIPMAAGADAFLVTGPEGLALVERDGPGVSLEIRQTQDGGNIGTLILENVPAMTIDGDATEALEHTIIATSAYLLGVMNGALTRTIDYLNTHQPPNTEEARQLTNDLQVQVSLTRAAITSGAEALDADTTLSQRQSAVSRAKLRAADSAIVVTRACSQILTGAGYALSNDIAMFLTKATVLAPLYGSSPVHRARWRPTAA